MPFIHFPACGLVPVRKGQRPIVLPEDADCSVPGNPLVRHPTWKHTSCPSCGGEALRETDTLDTFVDSSWYFLRFASAPADKPFDPAEIGRASCRERVCQSGRSRWSPSHDKNKQPTPSSTPP